MVDEINFKPSVIGRIGDYVTLRCAVRGNPTPKISWSKNNLLVS